MALVALCVLFTVALRLPFVTWPLMPDEAGMLIIAQHWSEGPFLYGDYFVGRGIALMLIYSLAHALGGDIALRLIACVIAACMVIAAGWLGHHLQGRAGAGWAALVAASYCSTYAFSANVMNGRMVAAALVVVSCACTLVAVRHPDPWSRASAALATWAGVAATTALLVIQSYAGGMVFAGTLLLVSWRLRALPGTAALRIAGAGAVGMLLPVLAVGVGVLLSWPTAAQVWFQMFGYRLDAVAVIGEDLDRPMERLAELIVIAAITGVALIVLCFVVGYRQLRRQRPSVALWAAILAMIGFAGVGMVLGGAWYPDYLLQLVPALVLATALTAPRRSWSGFGMRAGAGLAAIAAAVAVYLGLERPELGTPTNEADVGQWIAAGSEPGDTATVLWGKANVLHEAGMASPYPYLWSLLTRTLDPDLDLLVSTLRGPEAPTWVVAWYEFDSWQLDRSGDLARVVDDRYKYVGNPCGVEVYLLRSESRALRSPEACGVANTITRLRFEHGR